MWHATSCAPDHAEHALPLFESIADHGVSRRALRTALLTPAPASRQSRVSSVPVLPCHSAVRCAKSISPISPTCCATGLRARSMRPASCRCMGCEEVWGAPLVLSGCGGVYESGMNVVSAPSFPPVTLILILLAGRRCLSRVAIWGQGWKLPGSCPKGHDRLRLAGGCQRGRTPWPG